MPKRHTVKTANNSLKLSSEKEEERKKERKKKNKEQNNNNSNKDASICASFAFCLDVSQYLLLLHLLPVMCRTNLFSVASLVFLSRKIIRPATSSRKNRSYKLAGVAMFPYYNFAGSKRALATG